MKILGVTVNHVATDEDKSITHVMLALKRDDGSFQHMQIELGSEPRIANEVEQLKALRNDALRCHPGTVLHSWINGAISALVWRVQEPGARTPAELAALVRHGIAEEAALDPEPILYRIRLAAHGDPDLSSLLELVRERDDRDIVIEARVAGPEVAPELEGSLNLVPEAATSRPEGS